MPCLEAEPESWQAVGGSFIGGTTSVSSDFRGAKPRPIPINKVRACARKTTALTEQRPPVEPRRDDRRVVPFLRGEAAPHSS
jgi:hypothetical protein